MAFPVNINGHTYQQADFEGYQVFSTLPNVLNDMEVTANKAESAKTAAQAAVASLPAGTVLNSLTVTIDPAASEVTGVSYQNLNNALTWLADKRIKAGATVTLSCVAGTHTYSSAVTIDHPDGDRISIVGAAAYVSAGAITLTRSTSAPGYGGASSEANCVLTA